MAQQPRHKRIQPGDVIAGRYEVRDIVGRGGMGCIYRVYDKVLEEDVALKTLLPDHVDDKVVLERFFNEARIARSLSHPNVIRVHDIGMDEGIIYISMELLKGRSLRQMIDRLQPGQRLPINGILRMFDALCAALDYAHRYTVHRDIKPENVMVLPDGSVKLMDFGISKLVANPNLTSASVVMGTPHYMAPEQLKNTSAVDARADIYSMGVMLYEVITGDRPSGLAKPASNIRGEVPASLDPIIEKCCQPDPSKRFQSIAELREALREIRIAVEQGTDPGSGAKKKVAEAAATGSGFPWRPVVTVVFVLVILAGAAAGLRWAEERRQLLMESAAVEPVANGPSTAPAAAETPWQALADLMRQLRERSEAAIQEYPAAQQEQIFTDIRSRGDALWSAAQSRAGDSPGQALALAWDAAACYLAPILWPPDMVFVPPSAPDDPERAPGFFIDAKPISSAAFAAFANRGEGWPWPDDLRGVAPGEWPMVAVTYYDALAYLASQVPPKRLPTSREWERAFRAASAGERALPSTAEPRPFTRDGEGEGAAGEKTENQPAARRAYVWLHFPLTAFAEWTATFRDGTPAREPGAPNFGDVLLTRSAYWTAAGGLVLDQPAPLAYGRSQPATGFRGVRDLPRTLPELKASL